MTAKPVTCSLSLVKLFRYVVAFAPTGRHTTRFALASNTAGLAERGRRGCDYVSCFNAKARSGEGAKGLIGRVCYNLWGGDASRNHHTTVVRYLLVSASLHLCVFALNQKPSVRVIERSG